MVSLDVAIKSGFKRWNDFSGRSSRSELWFWILFIVAVNFVLGLIDRHVFGADIAGYAPKHHITALIFALVALIPGLAVRFRRLHDLNKTAWWLLLWLVPIVGWIVLLVWDCTRGTPGPNRFGPDPLAAEPINS
jgi:uncharacterized membrane protein YhaH (DUF805 family)